MARYLITGASGLLGLNLALKLDKISASVIGVSYQQDVKQPPFEIITCDLSQPGVIPQLLADTRPDVVIHCAALTIIDACENQPETARRINAGVPGDFAAECAKKNIQMLHISTDAVFDGERGNYREEDTPNPLSVYALTKLEGEQNVLRANPQALVARVNFFGWSLNGQRSLAEWFFNNLSAGNPVNGFNDIFFCSMQVNDLVDTLLEMIGLRLNGLYHTLSSQAMSKYEFGVRLAGLFDLNPDLIRPISWKEGGLKAARSPNLTLRTDKLAAALGHPLPSMEHGLQRLFDEYQAGYPQHLRTLGMNL
ncbi:MAG TPA: SDR family oxidoreductase [Anaerolineaceae bacterium]|nr:SDR family oxidoreductase [Anaerolineaceae bacterium]